MLCKSCNAENTDASKFCRECGASLAAEISCPNCQSASLPGSKFCNECGQPLTGAAAAIQRTPTPAPAPVLPTSFAGGRYEVKSFLGEGGRKRVYLAHDDRLDRDVAIAVIKTEGLDEAGLARVKREAQAMGRLGDHPHIVTIHDIGEDGSQPYIVSQYMSGGDLDGLIQGSKEHQLDIETVLRIGDQICGALEHAHTRGVIHRDLKPGNIWLTEKNDAKLGDFGLAMALDESQITVEGMMVGTVSYMPPEQALGRQAEARSDLYALGCVLYEMLTGRPPFLGDDTIAIISQHVNTAPIIPSSHNKDVPRSLDNLVMRLLSKNPADRPASAGAVAEELSRIGAEPKEEDLGEIDAVSDLGQAAWGNFVGRRDEIRQLKTAFEDTLSGQARLMMVVGEPGIGKTRLAQEFAVYAELRGARVLWGRCYEGEVVPYQPFVEAFREYARERPDDELREELGRGAPEMMQLVSEIQQRFPDIVEAPRLEGEAERIRLFESVTTFVRNATEARPVVLFLDDIHWADKPSLLLMQYLARNITRDRLMMVGTYRDVELDRTHPLSEVVAALRSDRLYERVLLRGLSSDDTRSMIAAVSEQEVTNEPFAEAIFRETEGNPFFIEEVLKHLVETGAIRREEGRWTGDPSVLDSIPEGVREVIGRRLERLSEGCNRLLTLASTMTGGFAWETLKAISGEEEAIFLDLIDEALRAQVIKERGRGLDGIYDFTHALIRQTLYGELSTPRRVVLHRQIGESLEGLYSANLEPHFGELAHHFYQAAPGGDVDKAIDYAMKAGRRAMGLAAYEEAARHFETARQATELKDSFEEADRCDLLIELAEAHNMAGDRDKAKVIALEAREIALAGDWSQKLAEAAFQFASNWGSFGDVDEQIVEIIEEALEATRKDTSALRSRMLSRLALEYWWGGDVERASTPSEDAVQAAREVGDTQALADALFVKHGLVSGPEHAQERLADGDELLSLGKSSGTKDAEFFGMYFRRLSFLELGQIAKADGELELGIVLVEEIRRPLWLAWSALQRGGHALLRGRFSETEEWTARGETLAQRAQDPGAEAVGTTQEILRLEMLGRLDDLDQRHWTRLEDMANGFTDVELALLHIASGDESAARKYFDSAVADDFNRIVSLGGVWPVVLSRLSAACMYLGDVTHAASIYQRLLPYEGQNIVDVAGSLLLGPASRYLARLAVTMSRLDDAAGHFEKALQMSEDMGARPYIALTQQEYAEMLLERGQAGDDAEKAGELVASALEIAEELGMAGVVERCLAMKLKAQGIDTIDAYTSIDAVASTVYTEKPDLRKHAAPDGTVTILFSDIEGSTAKTEELGDQRWMEVLREHNAIVREQLAAHDGFEVKSEGDGFMLAFQSARKALQCAIGMQRAFDTRNDSASEPILVRMGLHTGEVIKEGNDFFGKHVNLAARIAGQASGGEILVSSLLRELTASGGDINFGEGREVELKGLSGTQQIYTVGWS
ncbi:MAG: protein kinase [Chloroflexi bacterium]|nr:protein kinase [Chloroflexota bacterium]